MEQLIDTHTHLYLSQFEKDRNEAIERAIEKSVDLMLLPNIDATSWQPMLEVCRKYPEICFPMAGIHPTSVIPSTIETEFEELENQLKKNKFIAIGEIGIDLYWDKTHLELQEEIFEKQVQIALDMDLPVVIHVRESYNQVWRIIKKYPDLKGVFHCFPGNVIQAQEVIDAGFLLGIGGVLTYKNSQMQKVVAEFGLEHIVLETDSPYLTPVPYRGTRNEPAYIYNIAEKVAKILKCSINEVAKQTTANAKNIFKIK